MSPLPQQSQRLVLARGVNIIARDDDHIQFGVDATRTGVLRTPLAHELADILRTLATPMHRNLAVEAITAHTGQDEAEVRSLLDELLSFKVLTTLNVNSVYVLGSSPLADEIKAQLHDLGFMVRQPARGEHDATYLSQVDPLYPVVLVDKLAHASKLGATAAKLAPNALPVSLFDHRALIGPLRVGGHGPCLLCLQLELSGFDSMWHRVTQGLPDGPPRADPTVVALAAAEAITLLRRLYDEQLPPGIVSARPLPGDYVLVDPFVDQARTTGTMSAHRSCPVCLHARQTSGIG